MSILSKIFGRRVAEGGVIEIPAGANLEIAPETKSVEVSPALQRAIEQQLLGFGLNPALGITSFYRAAMSLAEGLAQLPIEIYRKTAKGSEAAIDHPLYDLLHYQPFEMLDSFQFWRTFVLHAVVTGDAVAYRNVVNGETRELIPIQPERRSIDFHLQTYEQIYRITFFNGSYADLKKDAVFHLSGPRWENHRGLHPASVGRNAIDLSKMTEQSQYAFHVNGARPSGMLTTQKTLTDAQIEKLKKDFAVAYAGAGKTGSIPVAHGGLDFKQISLSGVDAEHLDTRKHQIEEICRLVGVFPIIVGHAGDQSPTFASAESFMGAHVRFSVMPIVRAVAMAVNTQLLSPDERKSGYFCKIDTSEFTRGSVKDRTDYYKAALGSAQQPGWMTQNEVRADDGYNPDDEEASNELWRPMSVTTDPNTPDNNEPAGSDKPAPKEPNS